MRRGWVAEIWALEHFEKLGFQILGHRVPFIWAEVDGVLWRPGEIILLEVKSSPLCPESSISQLQSRRLARARAGLSGVLPMAVRVHLAAVYSRRHIDLYEDVLCDLNSY